MKEVRLTQAEIAMLPFGLEEWAIYQMLHKAGIDTAKEYSQQFDMATGDEVFMQKEEGE